MKYIKTFESYSSEEMTNEGLWKGIVNKFKGKNYGQGNKNEEESINIKTMMFVNLIYNGPRDNPEHELYKENPGLLDECKNIKKNKQILNNTYNQLYKGEDFDVALKDFPIAAKVLSTIYQACDTDGNCTITLVGNDSRFDDFQDLYDKSARIPSSGLSSAFGNHPV